MRYLLSTALLAAVMMLASGCRNPTPTFNPYGGFGSPTVAPPAVGGYPAAGAPAQTGFVPGMQQPAGFTGAQPVMAPASGVQPQPQPQNQQPVGTGATGWQASNSTRPATAASTASGVPETAVNRLLTPSITNGTLNEASYGGNATQASDPASELMRRIEQGRMRVHDATAPAGAAAPVPQVPYPGAYPAYPGYPAQAAVTPVPSYASLRGATLTGVQPQTPAALAPAALAPAAVTTAAPAPSSTSLGRSVLVSNHPAAAAASTATTTPVSATTTSDDGLNWRSKQSPDVEVATR